MAAAATMAGLRILMAATALTAALPHRLPAQVLPWAMLRGAVDMRVVTVTIVVVGVVFGPLLPLPLVRFGERCSLARLHLLRLLWRLVERHPPL